MLIAEQLRNLEKTLKTYVITRWNSILFTIKSVLSISDADFRKIRDSMETKTKKQKKTKQKFRLDKNDRNKLEELCTILELFQWFTNLMQSNQVSISCVYPCVLVIQNKLSEENAELMLTKQLRNDLLESLNKRFGDLIESDLCLIASFLDPRFGPKEFSSEKREKVKMRLKYHLGLINPRSKTNNIQTYTFTENIPSKFLFYQVGAETSASSFDDYLLSNILIMFQI